MCTLDRKACRPDAATAPGPEKELKECIDSVTELTLDFADIPTIEIGGLFYENRYHYDFK